MFATARSTISPLASPTLRNFAHSAQPARVGLGFNFPVPVASGSGAYSGQPASACRPPLRRMKSTFVLSPTFAVPHPHTPRLGSLADCAPMSPFILTPSSLAADDGYFHDSPLAKKSDNVKTGLAVTSEGQTQTSTGSITPRAIETSTSSRIARWESAYTPKPRKSNVERIGLGILGLTLGSNAITPTGNGNRINSFSPNPFNIQNNMAHKNTAKSVAFGVEGDEDCFADTESDTTTSLKRRRRRSSYAGSVSFHPKKLAKLVENRSIPVMQFTESDVSSLEPHLSTPLTMPITPPLGSSSVLPPFVL